MPIVEEIYDLFSYGIIHSISPNAKDPWCAYLENRWEKKPNILESALMGKVNLLGIEL